MLDTELLKAFCSGFYGYGAKDAPHWFLSMEEGGGTTEAEIAARIEAWHSRGRPELEDVASYHEAIGQQHWFSARPPVQRTWAAMIRIVLAYEGAATDLETVRTYQRDRLGRTDGVTRLSPLLPLPAKSLAHWNYGEWTEDDSLATRARYHDAFSALRIAHLAAALRNIRPRTVTFFGASYMHYWVRIATAPMVPIQDVAHAAVEGHTTFIACKHPATRGLSNEYFVKVGRAHRAAHGGLMR